AWPGNVRELRAAVHAAYLLQRSPLLHVEPQGSVPAPADGEGARIGFSVGTSLADLERRAVDATLAHYGNDKAAAARALGISVRTIYNYLARRGEERGRPVERGAGCPPTAEHGGCTPAAGRCRGRRRTGGRHVHRQP